MIEGSIGVEFGEEIGKNLGWGGGLGVDVDPETGFFLIALIGDGSDVEFIEGGGFRFGCPATVSAGVTD